MSCLMMSSVLALNVSASNVKSVPTDSNIVVLVKCSRHGYGAFQSTDPIGRPCIRCGNCNDIMYFL